MHTVVAGDVILAVADCAAGDISGQVLVAVEELQIVRRGNLLGSVLQNTGADDGEAHMGRFVKMLDGILGGGLLIGRGRGAGQLPDRPGDQCDDEHENDDVDNIKPLRGAFVRLGLFHRYLLKKFAEKIDYPDKLYYNSTTAALCGQNCL